MNVLALQRRRIGDILMTTPALRALKTRFPQAEVTYVCERPFSGVLRANEHVDTLLPVDGNSGPRNYLRFLATLRNREFDLALDFEGSPFTAALAASSGAARRIGYRSGPRGYAYTDRVGRPAAGVYLASEKMALLAPLGIPLRTPDLHPTLRIEERARDWAQRTLEAAGVASHTFLLTIAPAARAPEFRWPLARYAELLDLFATSHAFEVILLLPEGEEGRADELARLTRVPLFQLSTAPSTTQTAALLDRADLHVGNENAARHMATALGTATVTLYAPGARARWGMPGDPLQAGLEPPADEAAGEELSPISAVVSHPITRITTAAAFAALLGLETYLPRLRAARRAGATGGGGGQPHPVDPRLGGSQELPLWGRPPPARGRQPITPPRGDPTLTGGGGSP